MLRLRVTAEIQNGEIRPIREVREGFLEEADLRILSIFDPVGPEEHGPF